PATRRRRRRGGSPSDQGDGPAARKRPGLHPYRVAAPTSRAFGRRLPRRTSNGARSLADLWGRGPPRPERYRQAPNVAGSDSTAISTPLTTLVPTHAR